MKRRDFIKTSALGATLPFWLQSCDLPFGKADFPIHVHSDHSTGHLIMESSTWKTVKTEPVEVVIVGGGIAGLSAAHSLKTKSYQLYELSHRIGGASSAGAHQGLKFAQGAHYDLDYPEYYGEEVLQLLESLKIIRYQPWNRMWTFVDEQHLIPYARRQQCYDMGNIRSDVIPNGKERDVFLELMSQFTDQMPLPTRLIAPKLRFLNGLSFTQYLNEKIPLTKDLKRQIDYHMMDDYGGSADQVSALAGIHYFACRPYYRESVNLFSPPQGNDYFVQKLLKELPAQQIKTNHLVKHIEKTGDSYQLQILDIQQKIVIKQTADKIIYAGQKHALKYIYPEQGKLFDLKQAPWMVVSIITTQEPQSIGFWQNEFLGENPAFLGFVDSSVQSQKALDGKRVFTGYYCLKPADRNYLTTIRENKSRIIQETQEYLEATLRKSIHPEAAFIQVMGHAMAIPAPGYLFKDANQNPATEMHYAGVDNGRLPLLFEALDSGIQSTQLL